MSFLKNTLSAKCPCLGQGGPKEVSNWINLENAYYSEMKRNFYYPGVDTSMCKPKVGFAKHD
jgi:hypothetical protein